MYNKKAYRIVEQIPSESSEDDASGSDDEWLPEKEGLANTSSRPSDRGAEDGQKKSRNVWKTKDNQFERDLPPF